MSEGIPLPGGACRGITRRPCRLARSALARLAMSIAAIVLGGNSVCAQEATSLGQPQFFVTPYLWLAGVYATTATPLARVPEVDSAVGPFELLGHLDGAPSHGVGRDPRRATRSLLRHAACPT